jgi:hypothetical protein
MLRISNGDSGKKDSSGSLLEFSREDSQYPPFLSALHPIN